MNNQDFYNKIQKVVYDGATVTFIIQTEGESDFWHWSVNWHDVADYFQNHKNKVALLELVNEKLSPVNCNIFINDLENDTLGCSCCSFDSIEDALKDLGVIK